MLTLEYDILFDSYLEGLVIVGGIDGNNDGSHVGQTLLQRLIGALADVLEALVRGRLHAGVVVAPLILGTSPPRHFSSEIWTEMCHCVKESKLYSQLL